MTKIKKSLNVAAVILGMVSLSSQVFAAGDGNGQNGQTYGSSKGDGKWNGSNYGFTVNNNVKQDIWATWYASADGNQRGSGCIGPGQHIMIGSNSFEYGGVYLQIEFKGTKSTNCGGNQSVDLTNVGGGQNSGWTVASGGTSHADVNGNTVGSVHYTQ